jgi:hypothetical protein
MEQNIYSQPVTWLIIALLSVYLFLLLRAMFSFFFKGGRRKLLEQESAVARMQPGANGETPPEPSPAPKSGIKALKMLA